MADVIRTSDSMGMAERCKLFCEWMGGSPCARADCPRLKEQADRITRDACTQIEKTIREGMES